MDVKRACRPFYFLFRLTCDFPGEIFIIE